MTLSEAKRLVAAQAAGLIENMDLTQLYGDDQVDDDNEAVLDNAQKWLVTRLQALA